MIIFNNYTTIALIFKEKHYLNSISDNVLLCENHCWYNNFYSRLLVKRRTMWPILKLAHRKILASHLSFLFNFVDKNHLIETFLCCKTNSSIGHIWPWHMNFAVVRNGFCVCCLFSLKEKWKKKKKGKNSPLNSSVDGAWIFSSLQVSKWWANHSPMTGVLQWLGTGSLGRTGWEDEERQLPCIWERSRNARSSAMSQPRAGGTGLAGRPWVTLSGCLLQTSW